MKTLNLTYALKDNSLVHISEVESGLQCGCKCPACGETLIARKGDKVIHHFAHKSTVECEFGYQTSLHLAAKKVISENGIILKRSITFLADIKRAVFKNVELL